MFCLIKKLLLKVVEKQVEIVREKINELKEIKASEDKERVEIINIEIGIQEESLEFLSKLWIAFIV